MLPRLSSLPLESLARAAGLVRRRPRKFCPAALLQSLLVGLGRASPSWAAWAAVLSALQGRTISKQGLHRRGGPALIAFLEQTLAALLGRATASENPAGALEGFGRVLLQDSTALSLHPRLAGHFPGCGNQCQRALAGVKVQAIFELRSQSWVHFGLEPLAGNDQRASPRVLDHLRADDLVIRDLGYAVLDVWAQVAARGAFFLSRWRADFTLLDPGDGQDLDPLALFKDRDALDREVLVGREARLPARLVAVRLPPAVAAERRRTARAKARRDPALRLSRRHLRLLGWTILLTNAPAGRLDARQALAAYGCRWQVEVLFKSWKSHFALGGLPRSNPRQVHLHLLAKLLAIALAQNFFPSGLRGRDHPPLSPLKVAAHFALLLPFFAARPGQDWLGQLGYFGRYDARKRPHFFQKLAAL